MVDDLESSWIERLDHEHGKVQQQLQDGIGKLAEVDRELKKEKDWVEVMDVKAIKGRANVRRDELTEGLDMMEQNNEADDDMELDE